MGHTTVRISDTARETLRTLARREGHTMQALLEEAIEALRRKRFLNEVNAAYSALRGDAKAWAAVEAERREWDASLLDGLGVHESRAAFATRKRRKARQKTT